MSKLRQRIDHDIAQVEQLAASRRTTSPVPISPLHVQHKMGFKPVVSCDCGSSIDLNTAKRREVEAWREEHQTCTPTGAAKP